MAPDRGSNSSYEAVSTSIDDGRDTDGDADDQSLVRRRSDARRFLAQHAGEGQNFTLRGILVGLGVGLVICFSVSVFLWILEQ